MFNRQVVNHLFSEDFLEAIKVLSPHPIIKVPVRNNGITSCEPQRCYWNSSIVSQTFGGEVIYGFIVDSAKEGTRFGKSVFLLGHGCWLNPEGELVDVSPTESNDREFRYFLPVDRKLILNGVATEQIKNYLYVDKVASILYDLTIKAAYHTGYLLFNPPLCKKRDESEGTIPYFSTRTWGDDPTVSLEKKVIDHYSQFEGKLVQCNAWPMDFVLNYLDAVRNKMDNSRPEKFDKEYWSKIADTFNPSVKEVNASEDIVSIQDFRRELQDFLWECIHEAKSSNLTIWDVAGNNEITELSGKGNDSTWCSALLENYPLPNPSTTTGKFIKDYVPRSLNEVEFPKKKSKKRKVEKYATKYGLTPEEVLLLSDPYHFPHPYIVEKTGLGSEKFPVFSRI